MQERAEVDDASARPPLKLVRRRPGGFDLGAVIRDQWRMLSVLATLLLGVVFIMLGWYGAAHTNIITEQIPYLISGGLLGLGLILLSGIMAYSFVIERQNEQLRRDIARALAQPRTVTTTAVAAPVDAVAGEGVFILPGGRSFHLAGCPIIENKDGVRSLTPAKALSAGYAACKLCSED